MNIKEKLFLDNSWFSLYSVKNNKLSNHDQNVSRAVPWQWSEDFQLCVAIVPKAFNINIKLTLKVQTISFVINIKTLNQIYLNMFEIDKRYKISNATLHLFLLLAMIKLGKYFFDTCYH